VNVDDQRRTTGAMARRRDGLDDGREASGMIPVPVRQKQHVDAGQVDG
jgi:hypothetical protein